MSSTITDNERTTERIATELWTEGNLSVVDELYAEDCLLHVPQRGVGQGREAVKAWVRDTRTTFPNLSITLTQTFTCEDTTCGIWSMTGTHEGEMVNMDIPPTGADDEFSGVFIVRFEDGKVREEWNVGDTVGMLGQIGVFESAE